MTGFHRFPLSNFKYFLTLFSKFFSSFPHGTCSLSVSRQYLALEDIYLPFSTAFSNCTTLWRRNHKEMVQDPTGLSPSMALPSSRLGPRPPQKTLLETTIRLGNLGDFKFELFPLHSPLLRESLLVSFPPLIDMLKFSGSSCLIWDQSIRCTTYCIETSNHSQASTGTVSVYRSPGMFRYEPYTRGYLIGIAKRFGMNSFKFRDSIFRTLRKGNKVPN